MNPALLEPAMDLICLGLVTGFFLLCVGLVQLCARLRG